MKSLCVFCMKEHKRRTPNLCKAKGDILKKYSQKIPFWKVMAGVESGAIDLEGEALKLLNKK